MPRKYQKNCEYCGVFYKGEGRSFCSALCRNRARANDKEWREKISIASKRLWQSKEGRAKMMRRKPSRLGAILSEETKRKIRISHIGKNLGSENPNWKGDKAKTPIMERIRFGAEYKEWRTAVFERDDYTCQFCGKRGGIYIEADHIKPFSQYPELRFEISNGRTLCKPCHRKTPTFGWLAGVHYKRKEVCEQQ